MNQISLFDTTKTETISLIPEKNLKSPEIESGWKSVLETEFKKTYFLDLKAFLSGVIKEKKIVYPPPKQIFNAFDQCPFEKVKVVILGQDPYHGENQAHGLCFSVNKNIPIPPSLQNIYQEIYKDLELPVPKHGNLEYWASQGVLLLNATLTVEHGKPASHSGKGWETFTDSVIKILSEKKEGLVFLLWGKFARSKKNLIDTQKHFVLEAAHPSPLSAYSGFFGCRHFSRTNEILKQEGKPPIDWGVK